MKRLHSYFAAIFNSSTAALSVRAVTKWSCRTRSVAEHYVSAGRSAASPEEPNCLATRRTTYPTSGKFADGLTSLHDFDPHLLPQHPHQRHCWRTKTLPVRRRRPPVTSAGNWTRRFRLHCKKW